ncbi:nucleotidyltransferase family protein [Parafilimonas sp.]|uniref:nucleotidyltransferase family protein n=1 Tax=Parafilimonas sp. TaxID=1969739 RepID=UPI003F7F4F07
MHHPHQYLQILSRQKQKLLKNYPIKTLGLFGSVVRNDFTPESDIDVIVEFTRPVGIEFIELADDLEKIFERKVDLVSRKGLREKTFDFIKEEIQYV